MRLQLYTTTSSLFREFYKSNSGLHACALIILPTEPYPPPHTNILAGSNNTPKKVQTPKTQTLFMSSAEVTQEH